LANFAQSVVIDAPVPIVFVFHERDDALQLLSPPFPPIRIVSKSGGLQVGARVEVRIAGLPWTALHTAYQPNRLFVDEQIRGPFQKWIHRHEFEDLGTKTRLTDRVEYILPGGAIVTAFFGWAVRIALRRAFVYRHRVTRRICESLRTGIS
jgi:ligand-binding SRPBCC domain-containing protein